MAKPDVLFYSPYRREDKMATSSLGQSESPHVTGSKSDAKPDEPTERLTSTSLTPTRMATACPTSREHSLVADIGHGQINHGAAVSMAAHDCRREPGARLTPNARSIPRPRRPMWLERADWSIFPCPSSPPALASVGCSNNWNQKEGFEPYDPADPEQT